MSASGIAVSGAIASPPYAREHPVAATAVPAASMAMNRRLSIVGHRISRVEKWSKIPRNVGEGDRRVCRLDRTCCSSGSRGRGPIHLAAVGGVSLTLTSR